MRFSIIQINKKKIESKFKPLFHLLFTKNTIKVFNFVRNEHTVEKVSQKQRN